MITLRTGVSFETNEEWSGYKLGVIKATAALLEHLDGYILFNARSGKAREDGSVVTATGMVFENDETYQAYVNAIENNYAEIEFLIKRSIIPQSTDVVAISEENTRKAVTYTNGKKEIELFITKSSLETFAIMEVMDWEGHSIIKKWSPVHNKDHFFASRKLAQNYISAQGFFKKHVNKEN